MEFHTMGLKIKAYLTLSARKCPLGRKIFCFFSDFDLGKTPVGFYFFKNFWKNRSGFLFKGIFNRIMMAL